MPDPFGRPTRKERAAAALAELDSAWAAAWESFPTRINGIRVLMNAALNNGVDRREVIDVMTRER